MHENLADWLKRLERQHHQGIDLGLERCGEVFQSMGAPRPARKIITVAGTNGKGSMVAYLDSILRASGYRCGTYTSPHLIDFNERIKIVDVPVSDQALIKAFERTEACRHEVSLTYFEFTTLAAFWLLQEADLDYAILEVGLGGRLDTVNLVDPDCAVITPIGLDHQEYLGKDREAIGREKAGIMRPELPVICGDRTPPATVLQKARSFNARLLVLGRDFDFRENGDRIVYQGVTQTVQVPRPQMPGQHQLDNLATALAVIETVQADCLTKHDELAGSIRSARLAGRLSRPGRDARVLVDVGHNPLAAEVVAQHLAAGSPVKTVCVLGMLKDKDAERVVQVLAPWISRWYCAGLNGERGQTGDVLGRRVKGVLPQARVQAYSSVAEALASARADAEVDERILVFGSFFTAAEALRILGS